MRLSAFLIEKKHNQAYFSACGTGLQTHEYNRMKLSKKGTVSRKNALTRKGCLCYSISTCEGMHEESFPGRTQLRVDGNSFTRCEHVLFKRR